MQNWIGLFVYLYLYDKYIVDYYKTSKIGYTVNNIQHHLLMNIRIQKLAYPHIKSGYGMIQTSNSYSVKTDIFK